MGSAAVTVVPSADDAISSSPCRSATRSRMPVSPKPSRGAPGSKPRPSSRTQTCSTPSRLGDPDRRRGGAGVPDRVVDRLLDDPVQRGLELRRVARRRAGCTSALTVIPRARRCACASPSIAAAAPSSSSAAGRSSRISPRSPSISSSSRATASTTARRARAGIACPGRAVEQHPQAAEPLQRVVVQLARPAPALGLRRLHRVAQALLLDRARRRHRGRGAGRERLQQRLVIAVRRARRAPPASRATARGTPSGTSSPSWPTSPSASRSPASSAPGLRRDVARAWRRRPCRRARAAGSRARARRSGPAALDDQLEDPVEVGLTADRARDRRRRLQPAHGRSSSPRRRSLSW